MTLADRAYKLRAVERFLALDSPTVPHACLAWVRLELHHSRAAIAHHVESLERLVLGCTRAVELAARFGPLPSPGHKAWVIDQMVRAVFVGHVPRHITRDERHWRYVPTHNTAAGRYAHWRRQQHAWLNGDAPADHGLRALTAPPSRQVAEAAPADVDANPHRPDLTVPAVPREQVATRVADLRARWAEIDMLLDERSQRTRACVHMLEHAARTSCLPGFPEYRMWLIDQMVRALLGEHLPYEHGQPPRLTPGPHLRYERWRAAHPDWNEGMAPP